MNTRLLWLAVPLLAVLVLGSADLAQAKKPVKPPPPPPEPQTGGIYYGQGTAMWVMDSGGGTQVELALENCREDGPGQGTPSYELHGEQRWFLQICDTDTGTHPDGRPHEQLFATNEESTIRTQLTFDTTVEFSRYGWRAEWMPGDEGVSFVAHRWAVDPITGEDVVVEAGVYAAPVLFDGDGIAIGLDSTPTLAAACGTTKLNTGEISVDIGKGFAWSPDGSRIVSGHWGEGTGAIATNELWLTSVATPHESTLLAVGGNYPDWSVDGLITFTTGLTLEVMYPTDEDSTTLISAPRNSTVHWPSFSTDGSSIVYTVYSAKTRLYAIYKTAVSKPRGTNLDTLGLAYAWR